MCVGGCGCAALSPVPVAGARASLACVSEIHTLTISCMNGWKQEKKLTMDIKKSAKAGQMVRCLFSCLTSGCGQGQ